MVYDNRSTDDREADLARLRLDFADVINFRGLAPRPRYRSLTWFRAFLVTDLGRNYEHGMYPHIGAPGGPCDVLDDPYIAQIWLQWATRLGKTFFGQGATLFTAATRPRPMMFASADETVGEKVVARTYKMYANCLPLKDQLRPEHKRHKKRIDFDFCRVLLGYARSPASLADEEIHFGHAGEIDKWVHQSTSQEADPHKLFEERLKNCPQRKSIHESTPAVKGRSRIERGRLGGTNCKYYVPCPHCGRYQTLDIKQVRWEKDGGRSDRDLARRTAYYECVHCNSAILDHHRAPMMRVGVWVPEGCGVDDTKARAAAMRWSLSVAGADDQVLWRGWSNADWITGQPVRDGRDASYQLSSLYALSLGWGDIAAEWVRVQGKPQDLRNFINSWLGETWEISERKTTWEKLGERLIVKVPRGQVPPTFSLLTAGVDKQDEHFVFAVKAYGPQFRSHLVTYGTISDQEDSRGRKLTAFEWLLAHILTFGWPFADGPNKCPGSLRIRRSLIDSGFRPRGVAPFVRQCRRQGLVIDLCKGSSTSLGTPFTKSVLGPNTATPGMTQYLVDTLSSQDALEAQLHDIAPGEPGSLSIYEGSLEEHQDCLQQLLNDAVVSALDDRNYARERWERIDENIPNDIRDCCRYADTAMLIETRGRPLKPRDPQAAPAKKAPPRGAQQRGPTFLERPGGWATDFRQ